MATMIPFSTAFTQAVQFGLLTAVHLPDDPSPVPEEVLARLPKAELEHAHTLKGYRQVSFVGGRLALHETLGQLRMPNDPILNDAHGCPVMPDGMAGSISHKRTLAIALVARSRHGQLGLDLEDLSPERMGVAEKVLRPEELEELLELPPERQWTSLLLRFSLKEAVYKVLNPTLRRYIDFQEARIHLDLDLTASVDLYLKDPKEHSFSLDGRYQWMDGRVLTMMRMRPDAHSGSPLNGNKGRLKGSTEAL
jgi:4'-phosphopantetheinyl transferase EntD